MEEEDDGNDFSMPATIFQGFNVFNDFNGFEDGKERLTARARSQLLAEENFSAITESRELMRLWLR